MAEYVIWLDNIPQEAESKRSLHCDGEVQKQEKQVSIAEEEDKSHPHDDSLWHGVEIIWSVWAIWCLWNGSHLRRRYWLCCWDWWRRGWLVF